MSMDGCQWYILEAYVRNIFCTKIKKSKRIQGSPWKDSLEKTITQDLILFQSCRCRVSYLSPTSGTMQMNTNGSSPAWEI